MATRKLLPSVGFSIALAVLAPSAFAQPKPEEPTAPAAADPARDAFREGAKWIDAAEWANALSAFERSLALRQHALTLYNIGVCHRFLGRYTLAVQTLEAALARAETQPNEMAEAFREQARAYVAEMLRKLVTLKMTLTPAEATTAIDGRPLSKRPSGELVAGVAPPGEGKRVGPSKFDVVVDPGPHVFTFQLPGHDTIEIRRDFKQGARDDLSVSLTEQNAQLQIDADRPKAVVRVDDVDIGLTPISVTRPPGKHTITVAKDGFVTYGAQVTLKPGQSTRLDAELPVERVPITKRWWFWTGAVAIVATGALVTYFVTRPDPEPPPYEGGSTGWIVPVK